VGECNNFDNIIMPLSVNGDGVWFGNLIYWTLVATTTTNSLGYPLQRSLYL
jgi:hypothetical protein